MKTKLFSFFLAIVISIGILNAEVYNGTCGENLTWSLNTEDSVMTIEGSGSMTNWSSSSDVPWESYKSYIKELHLPAGLLRISSSAFILCDNLTSITLAGSNLDLSDCGNMPFGYSRISEIHFIGTIEEWCTLSFETKKGIAILSNYDLYIGNELIKDIVIPNSITDITGAFYHCWSLTSVVIPRSVTSIGESAFEDCFNLTSVTIPNSITSIGDGAFTLCFNLSSISIPNSVTRIGTGAFNMCAYYDTDSLVGFGKFNTISIPNSVQEIGEYAFAGCGLSSLTIPGSVINIGEKAFSLNTELTSVTINSDAIVNRNYIEKNTIWGHEPTNLWEYFGEQVTEYIIGDSVKGIGNYAFQQCPNMTTISIGKNVARIGYGAFSSCDNLSEVHISDIATWCEIDFFSFGQYKGGLDDISSNPISYAHNIYLGNELIADLVIPVGTKKISYGAFYGCNCITSATIPGSVSKIGDQSFAYCENLNIVYIENGVDTIGSYAFGFCKQLGVIYVPHCAYEAAFHAEPWMGCSIKEFHFRGSLEEWFLYWCSDVFTDDSAYGGYDFYINDEKIEDLVVPESITTIKRSVFRGCNSLKSLVISDNVTTMEGSGLLDPNHAFENCKNLQTVTLGNSLTKIESWAFNGCTSLLSIEIPNSVDSIGYYAFADCINLTSVSLGDNVINIGRYAFYNCSTLDSITIPHSIIEIGDYAFANCTGMKTIVIEEGIQKLRSTVFSRCIGLTSVTCLAKVPPVMGKNRIIAGGTDKTYYVFDYVDCSKIPLYVPDESIEDYKAVEQWNWFKPILPLSQKSPRDEAIGEILSNNTSSSVQKMYKDGQILIFRSGKTYTLTGQEVK